MYQVKNNVPVRIIGKSIFMYSYPLSSCQLCLYAIISKLHFIIPRTSNLCVMTETGAVSLVRSTGSSGIQLQLTCGGHNQNITQIRLSRTTQMGMAESHNCRIMILISGTIFIRIFLISSIYVVRNRICIRT